MPTSAEKNHAHSGVLEGQRSSRLGRDAHGGESGSQRQGVDEGPLPQQNSVSRRAQTRPRTTETAL